MALSAVRAAFDTVKPIETPDEIKVLVKERDLIRTKLYELLPFEAAAREQLEARVTEFDRQITSAETAHRYSGLSVLPNNILSWTKRQPAQWRWLGKRWNVKMPTFAYVPVEASACILYASRGMIHPHNSDMRPMFVRREMDKAMKDAASYTESWGPFREIILTYRYEGIVPQEIRDIIEREQDSNRFEQLAFICEVDKWEVQGRPRPPRQLLDPILVGVKNETLFVLGSFDPTPIEDYLIKEFAS